MPEEEEMSILALFYFSIGDCGPQHKFLSGNPDKDVTCGVVFERGLARWRHKSKSSIVVQFVCLNYLEMCESIYF